MVFTTTIPTSVNALEQPGAAAAGLRAWYSGQITTLLAQLEPGLRSGELADFDDDGGDVEPDSPQLALTDAVIAAVPDELALTVLAAAGASLDEVRLYGGTLPAAVERVRLDVLAEARRRGIVRPAA